MSKILYYHLVKQDKKTFSKGIYYIVNDTNNMFPEFYAEGTIVETEFKNDTDCLKNMKQDILLCIRDNTKWSYVNISESIVDTKNNEDDYLITFFQKPHFNDHVSSYKINANKLTLVKGKNIFLDKQRVKPQDKPRVEPRVELTIFDMIFDNVKRFYIFCMHDYLCCRNIFE